MNKIIILLLFQLFSFQFSGEAKSTDKIEIEVINIMTGHKVVFDYTLIFEFNESQIQANQFIDRNIFTELKSNEIVKLTISLTDYNFECELPVYVLQSGSKLIYKLNFNPNGRWTKIIWTNVYGETLTRHIKNGISIPNRYQSLEILNSDYQTISMDHIGLFNQHFNPSIMGEYRSILSDVDILQIDVVDLKNLVIYIKTEDDNINVINGTWIYIEDLDVIWISTITPFIFNLENYGKVNSNTCSFEMNNKNEIVISRYVERHGAILNEELLTIRKK